MASDVQKKGSWAIYNSAGTGIAKAAMEMSFRMEFRRQETLISAPFELGVMSGFLSEEFTYSSNANYENVWNPTDILPTPLANLLRDETQRSFATYGYATKRTFTNTTSQTLVIKWRTVSHSSLDHGNWTTMDGRTFRNPVVISKALMSTTMPSVGKDGFWNFTSVSSEIAEFTGMKAKVKTAFDVNPGTSFGLNNASKTAEAASNAGDMLDAVQQKFSNAANDLFPKHPPICRLKIGNFFDKDYMVVKNVEVSFSKEFSEPGVPLYGDYTVTLESLFNSANNADPKDDLIFGTGLIVKNDSRVIDVSTPAPSQDTQQSLAFAKKTPTSSQGQAAPAPIRDPFALQPLPSAKPMQQGLISKLGLNK